MSNEVRSNPKMSFKFSKQKLIFIIGLQAVKLQNEKLTPIFGDTLLYNMSRNDLIYKSKIELKVVLIITYFFNPIFSYNRSSDSHIMNY